MIQSYLRYNPQAHPILHYGLLFHFPSKIASSFAVLEMVDWIDLNTAFPWGSLYFFLNWTLFSVDVFGVVAVTTCFVICTKFAIHIS